MAYHEGEEKFFLRYDGNSDIRSYITDKETTYTTSFRFNGVASPPPFRERNQLNELTAGTVRRTVEPFEEGSFHREIPIKIEPNKTCHLKYQLEYWVQAGTEENTWCPARFTRFFTMTIKNNLSHGVRLRVEQRLGQPEGPIVVEIPAAGSIELCRAENIPPDELAYRYFLLPMASQGEVMPRGRPMEPA
jgi:hypothetical protein